MSRKKKPSTVRVGPEFIKIYKRKSGPIKHRNTPRGGSRKRDYLRETGW